MYNYFLLIGEVESVKGNNLKMKNVFIDEKGEAVQNSMDIDCSFLPPLLQGGSLAGTKIGVKGKVQSIDGIVTLRAEKIIFMEQK